MGGAYSLTESSNISICIAYYMKPVSEVPIEVIQYAVIVLPLQGMWNCLIYFRPRYVAYKKRQQREREKVERMQKIKATNAFMKALSLEISNGSNDLASGSSGGPQRTTSTAVNASSDVRETMGEEENVEEQSEE